MMTLVLSLIFGPILGFVFANVQHVAQIITFPPAIIERPLDRLFIRISPWIFLTTVSLMVVGYFTNLHTAIFLSCLLMVARIDYKFGLIPDILLLIATIATLFHLSGNGLMIAIILGFGLYAIDAIWLKIKGFHVCGRGDIKLLALTGFWIGWHYLSVFLIAIGLLSLGIAALKREQKFPLGPAIVAATVLLVLSKII